MTSVSQSEVQVLDSVSAPLCVSFYLPTEPGASNQGANRIRLKNCVKALKQHIQSSNYPRAQKSRIIKQLERLRDSSTRLSEGGSLGAFIGDRFTRVYSLPEAIEPEMYVGTSFHTQPLRRALANK